MSRSKQPDGADPLTAHDQQVLDFEAVREDGSTSWQRADPRAALLERWGRYGFLVMLPDGDSHFCALGRRPDGEFIGWCKCRGFRYHGGACAHLCTVRKAAFVDLPDDRLEKPVSIHRVAEVDDMSSAEHTAAQRSGEVFDGGESNHGTGLDELTPSQLEVYLAVRERDLQPHEVAEETDRSASCARSLLHQARKRLREV